LYSANMWYLISKHSLDQRNKILITNNRYKRPIAKHSAIETKKMQLWHRQI